MTGRSLGISTVTLTVTTVTNQNSFACVFSVARFSSFAMTVTNRYMWMTVTDGYTFDHYK
jgi:hypothetical protein